MNKNIFYIFICVALMNSTESVGDAIILESETLLEIADEKVAEQEMMALKVQFESDFEKAQTEGFAEFKESIEHFKVGSDIKEFTDKVNEFGKNIEKSLEDRLNEFSEVLESAGKKFYANKAKAWREEAKSLEEKLKQSQLKCEYIQGYHDSLARLINQA